MEETGYRIGFFRAEHTFICVPDIFDREKSMGICCLEMICYPGNIDTIH